jgi:HAE1 family hydrophobic/amphiphilic exporter-1
MLEKLFDLITRGSLRFRWVTIILSILLLVAGGVAFSQLNQELIPKIEFPQTIVLGLNPGMEADALLDQVTVPLEEALADIEGVVNVETTTSSGLVVAIVRNEFGVDQEAIRTRIQEAIDGLDYPEGMETPELLTFSLSDLPIASLSISAEDISLEDLKSLVESEIVPQLESVPFVAAVEISGGQALPEDAGQPAVPTGEPTPEDEPDVQPTAVPTAEIPAASEAVPLPPDWIAAGQMQGASLETTNDVTPEVIQGIASFAPQMLDLLTPEMLRAFSPDVLGWLPAGYIASLDTALQEELNVLAAPVGGLGALAAAAATPTNPEDLPSAWQSAGQAQGITLETVADLTPEIVQAIAQFAPEMLDLLTDDNLRLMTAEILAVLPDAFFSSLDSELQAELGEIIAAANVFVPTASITRVNGNHSLGMSIYKDQDSNTVSVSHDVFDELESFEVAYPDLDIEIVFEQSSFIEESVSGVTREGGLGAIFAVIVILVFLSGRINGNYRLSWRSTLVTAVSIPLSIFAAFAMFKWLPLGVEPLFDSLSAATAGIPVLGAVFVALGSLFPTGLTLNIMTLSGMTVAVGRVVDDSIVVLENIYRHIQRGDDRRVSVIKGTRDVSIAIFASTATTVVVFLPIGLIGGLVGEFFLPFGIAVTYALAASFLVAITIVPTLAFLFIRKEHLPVEKETSAQKAYTPILKWALDNKAATLGIAAALLIGSGFLFLTRPLAFLPDFGDVRISTSVDLPNGTQMAETDALVMQFEEALNDIDGLGSVQTRIGGGGGIESFFLGGSIDQSAASVSIAVDDPEQALELTALIRQEAESVFGEEYVVVSSGSMSSQGFGGFALVASAQDIDALEAFDSIAIDTLNDVEGLANVTSNAGDGETFLRVDGEQAVRYTGELETKDTLGVTGAAKEALIGVAPDGIRISEGFESQQQTEGFAQTIQAIGISVIIVYLVMVLTLGSFVHPLTILFSLPLAIIGASLALWVTGSILGLSSMVGMMMLVGIVVTNAIVLVDRVQANKKQRGMDTRDALVEAGRTRLRPILMTAAAAILALIPMAIGLSEGAIIASELAIVVIGGLTTSTLLTLVIVPVMFSLLDRFTRNRKQAEPDASA